MTDGAASAGAVRIVLVGRQPLLRAGFRVVLEGQADLHVVGEAGDEVEAIDLARRLLPDVVLVDLQNPRHDRITATGAIVDAGPAVRVLVLTADGPDDHLVNGIRAGVTGVLARDAPTENVVAAIRAVAAGDVVLSAPLFRRLLEGHPGGGPPAPSPYPPAVLSTLTRREREVLVQVARGRSNAEIARALSVSETTVKTHVGHVLTKLGLRDRVQAVVLAYESGLVHPGG